MGRAGRVTTDPQDLRDLRDRARAFKPPERPMPEPLIERDQNVQWHNWHRTDGVGGAVESLFTPRNRWADNSPVTPDKKFAPGLAGLQKIVGLAAASGKRVRALGSGWSLSPIAFVND